MSRKSERLTGKPSPDYSEPLSSESSRESLTEGSDDRDSTSRLTPPSSNMREGAEASSCLKPVCAIVSQLQQLPQIEDQTEGKLNEEDIGDGDDSATDFQSGRNERATVEDKSSGENRQGGSNSSAPSQFR